VGGKRVPLGVAMEGRRTQSEATDENGLKERSLPEPVPSDILFAYRTK
jgi:hypothetical protein